MQTRETLTALLIVPSTPRFEVVTISFGERITFSNGVLRIRNRHNRLKQRYNNSM